MGVSIKPRMLALAAQSAECQTLAARGLSPVTANPFPAALTRRHTPRRIALTVWLRRAQDAKQAQQQGREPIVRSAQTWLSLDFHVDAQGYLVPGTGAPGLRTRPYSGDGARAVEALVGAVRHLSTQCVESKEQTAACLRDQAALAEDASQLRLALVDCASALAAVNRHIAGLHVRASALATPAPATPALATTMHGHMTWSASVPHELVCLRTHARRVQACLQTRQSQSCTRCGGDVPADLQYAMRRVDQVLTKCPCKVLAGCGGTEGALRLQLGGVFKCMPSSPLPHDSLQASSDLLEQT